MIRREQRVRVGGGRGAGGRGSTRGDEDAKREKGKACLSDL